MSQSQFFCLMSVAFTSPRLPVLVAIALGIVCLCVAIYSARKGGQ